MSATIVIEYIILVTFLHTGDCVLDFPLVTMECRPANYQLTIAHSDVRATVAYDTKKGEEHSRKSLFTAKLRMD